MKRKRGVLGVAYVFPWATVNLEWTAASVVRIDPAARPLPSACALMMYLWYGLPDELRAIVRHLVFRTTSRGAPGACVEYQATSTFAWADFGYDTLTHLDLTHSALATIESAAFYQNRAIQVVRFGGTSIGHSAFFGSSLRKIIAPNVLCVEFNAFERCYNLDEAIMSPTSVGCLAFASCPIGSFDFSKVSDPRALVPFQRRHLIVPPLVGRAHRAGSVHRIEDQYVCAADGEDHR